MMCLRAYLITLPSVQIGDSGVIPCLIKLLSDDTPEGQDSGIGALANLAVIPRNRELIADAGGIEAVIKLLGQTGIDEEVLNMTVGTLANLATLPANQVSTFSTCHFFKIQEHSMNSSNQTTVMCDWPIRSCSELMTKSM